MWEASFRLGLTWRKLGINGNGTAKAERSRCHAWSLGDRSTSLMTDLLAGVGRVESDE